MEGYYAKPSALPQTVKCFVKCYAEMIQLAVHLDTDRLKGFFAGVLLSSCPLRNTRLYYFCKLHRRFHGLMLSCFNYPRSNPSGVSFLSVFKNYLRKLLTAIRIYNISCAYPLSAHAHIKRCIGMVGETSACVVKLERRNSQVKQNTVDLFYAQILKDRIYLRIIALYHLCGKSLKALLCDLYRIGISVYRYKSSAFSAVQFLSNSL